MTSLQQKDTTFTKIFVGGLPYHTTDDTLERYFEPYGAIEEAVVITDRQTGKSRGYGFVTMSDTAAAERACQDPNPIIDGRKANVNLAYLGAKPRVPVGELIAAFPYHGLKTGLPSYFGSAEILGIPQVFYPSAYHLSGTPAATSFTLATGAAAQHPPHLLPANAATMLPGPGGQFIDYATLAAAFASASASYTAAGSPLTNAMTAAAAGSGGCIPLTGDSIQTVAAFPFAVPTGAGGFITAAGSSAPPPPTAAYATLLYTATGALPNQRVLGQLSAHPIQPQHIHAKLQ